MIVDFFLKLCASLVGYVLGFLPTFALDPAVNGLGAAWSVIQPYFAMADWFAPVHEALGMLVGLVALRAALVGWFAINWFYRRIPFLGH